jgi:membrane fusion protein, copper/silver efflux system
MKEKLRSKFYPALLLFSASLFSCNENAKNDEHDHTSEQTYYCPMDTDIVQHKPGACPKCKMNLIKKDSISNGKTVYYCPMCPGQEQDKAGICKICNMDLIVKPDSSVQGNNDPAMMQANSTVLSSVKAIKTVEKTVPVKLEAKGYINYDPNRFKSISSRYEGRIEKLYVKYAYQPVKKGQKLMEIFSHELRTAQHDYLFIMQNDFESKDLLKAARQKLQLSGMSSNQIEDLEKMGHVNPTTTVYSPYDGYVVEDFQNEELNSGLQNKNKSGMEPMDQRKTLNATNDLLLREGAYVNKEQEIFKIVNTDMVWGIFEIYAENIALIKLNQAVRVKAENSDEFINGKVNFIEPDYSNGSKTMKVRVYLNNKNHQLKIGNLLYAEIDGGNKNGKWIPKTAVVDLGNKKIVFIKNKDVYQTRQIETGSSTSEEIEVLNGISIDDEIAENAQYLIDSESFVKLK